MTLSNELLLAFYGDDFSGSTDAMEALAKAGLRTVLFLEPPRPEQLARFAGLRVVGVAGVSRSLSPEEMEAELPPLFARLRDLPAPLLHVKVCSTFDSSPQVGSIGRAIEIGQRLFPARPVPLVVGAPILGRYCVFGSLFARYTIDAPLDIYRLDHHPTMRRHPVTPMDEADLRVHLGRQTKQTMANFNVLMLEGQEDVVDRRYEEMQREKQPRIILFDTLTDAHLATVGRLLWRQALAERPLFCVGSSGVEYALTAHWGAQGMLPEAPTFRVGPVERIVVVSGSCSPVTAQQIEWAAANGFMEVPLDTARILAGQEEEAVQTAVRKALTALADGRSVVLHTCRGPEDPRFAETSRLLSPGRESGRRLGGLLGRILRETLLASGVRRAVVTGGDTSGYVARTLGIEALETARPMAPGSPLCRAFAAGSPLDGLEILFKGGQVGQVDLFGSILRGEVQGR